jgi:nucleoside-diphosphate-sugar epimerase
MASHANDGIVLVTGASGFVAMQCIVELLRAGWRVRGTLRDLARGEAVAAIVGREVDAGERLSFVHADLAADRGWAEAVAGCRFVLHVASPVPAARPARADDVIIPARDGTLRVLRAASAARVERVVMTSSTTAVFYGRARDGSKIYDEADWSVLSDAIGAYERSKTLAERAAWDYVGSLTAPDRLELVTLLPGAVLGPVLGKELSVSGEIVRKLLARELPGCPDLGWALVDVRDVAIAHVTAMTHPRAAGQRFILASEHVAMREIAGILAARFTPLGFKIPLRRVPSWLLKLIAMWDKTVALVVPELGQRQDVSNARAVAVLGWQPRGVAAMVVDMADSMIRHGVVAARAPATAS